MASASQGEDQVPEGPLVFQCNQCRRFHFPLPAQRARILPHVPSVLAGQSRKPMRENMSVRAACYVCTSHVQYVLLRVTNTATLDVLIRERALALMDSPPRIELVAKNVHNPCAA